MQDIIDKYILEGKTFREVINLAYDEKPVEKFQQGETQYIDNELAFLRELNNLSFFQNK